MTSENVPGVPTGCYCYNSVLAPDARKTSEKFWPILARRKFDQEVRGFLLGDAVKECTLNRYGSDFEIEG